MSRPAAPPLAKISNNHVNGEELCSLDLRPLTSGGEGDGPAAAPSCFRELVELDHNAYKSLLLAVSEENDLYAVNLQNETFQKLSAFAGNVQRVAVSRCRRVLISRYQ